MKKKNVKNNKKLDRTSIILLTTFIVLLILVIVLLIVVLTRKEDTTPKADMVISLSNKNLESSFSIGVDDLGKDDSKTYTFKVRNYRNDKLNKVRINYVINFKVGEGIKLSLYKNEAGSELLNDTLELDRNTLRYDVKQDDYYELKIKAEKDQEEKSTVDVEIIGEKVK